MKRAQSTVTNDDRIKDSKPAPGKKRKQTKPASSSEAPKPTEAKTLYVLSKFNRLVLGVAVAGGTLAMLLAIGSVITSVFNKGKIKARFVKHQESVYADYKGQDKMIQEKLSVINFDEFSTNCQELLEKGFKKNGVYMIVIGHRLVEVICDMEGSGGGWTVIQARKDGSIDFNRNYNNYVSGFGNFESEFWLGLSMIHEMTIVKNYQLKVELEDFNSDKMSTWYSTFSVGPPETNYKLSVSGASGDAGDALTYHNEMPFSTYDKDNDASYDKNCSEIYKGGWWFKNCYNCNLNGFYFPGGQFKGDGIVWSSWLISGKDNYSFKTVTMKVRPLKK